MEAISVVSIDGKKVGFAGTAGPYNLEALPGRHVIEVKLNKQEPFGFSYSRTVASRGTLNIFWHAEAGRAYTIHYDHDASSWNARVDEIAHDIGGPFGEQKVKRGFKELMIGPGKSDAEIREELSLRDGSSRKSLAARTETPEEAPSAYENSSFESDAFKSSRQTSDIYREKLKAHQIQDMGLAKDVDDLLLGSTVQGVGDRFRVQDGQITWFCRFHNGLRSFKASLKKPRFYATWYDPDGQVYQEDEFTLTMLNADLARNTMKLNFENVESKLGVWRVEIKLNGETLDVRNFELVR
jgi:hypothetical protein